MKTLVAIAVAGLVLIGPAAVAGPSPSHPATDTLTRSEAHRAAQEDLDMFFVVNLPEPNSGRVGHCHGGPYLWTCPIQAQGKAVRCRATMHVWADARQYFFELHGLRCGHP